MTSVKRRPIDTISIPKLTLLCEYNGTLLLADKYGQFYTHVLGHGLRPEADIERAEKVPDGQDYIEIRDVVPHGIEDDLSFCVRRLELELFLDDATAKRCGFNIYIGQHDGTWYSSDPFEV